MRKTLLLALMLTLPLSMVSALPASAQVEPALDWDNYEKITLTKNTGEPIDLAVLPDGRVIHTARNGDVRVTDPSTGVTRIVNTIPVYQNSEDGLQTVALDPDFDQNQWVYTYYAPVLDTPSGSAPNTLPEGEDESYWDQWLGVNRLARFKWTGDSLDLSTEQTIIEVEVQRGQCCHVAGDIDWDAEGNLYLSTGDNTPAGTPGANGYAPNNDAPGMNPGFDARRGPGNSNDLRGKILRITVQEDGSYTIPEGNLFADDDPLTRPEIFVTGLRNPFRMTVDAETGAVVWGDYGPDAGNAHPERGPKGYVEWQSTTVPINGGWPYCHGPNAEYNEWDFATATPGEWFDCDAPENNSRWNTGLTTLPGATAPQLYYGDNADDQPWPELTEFGPGGGQGPMGGPIYRYDPDLDSPTRFPEYWDGKAFFGEFSQDYMAAFTIPDPDGPVTRIENFLPNDVLAGLAQPIWDNPMDFEFGPDGSLYVLEYGDGFFRQNPDSGLYRVDYAPGNKTPTARIQASPRSGQAPLAVDFDASASADPEGAELTYEWDFDGDGTFDATGVTTSHSYTENGQYQTRLRVTDPTGKLGVTSVEITVGNTAPTVEIQTPPDGAFFNWGDAVPFAIEVTDPEDDSVNCSRVAWTFGLGHNQHAHPVNSGSGCRAGVPTPSDAGHGETENVFGVLGVTYTDAGANGVPGATGEAQVILNPMLQEAEHADATSGVEVADDASASGTRKVTSLDAGDWIAYDPVNFANITGVQTRASGAGTLSLRWNAPDVAPLATVTIPAGEGWQTVSTALADLPTESGRLYVTSTGGIEVDSLTFEGDGVADTTPPTVSATLDPAEPDGDNGWYVSDVVFTLNAEDNGTIASAEYSIDGGQSWSSVRNRRSGQIRPVTFLIDGVHDVLYRAGDNGGNLSEPGSFSIKIDKVAPTVALSGVEDGTSHGSSGTLTPEFSAEDTTSGVAELSATLDGDDITSGEEIALAGLAIGEHELVVRATDEAGNTTVETVTFSVATSFDDLAALIDGFAGGGQLPRQAEARLVSQVEVARRHAERGAVGLAVQALQRAAAVAVDARFVQDAAVRDVLLRNIDALSAELGG